MNNNYDLLKMAFYLSGVVFFLSNSKFSNIENASIIIGLIILNAIIRK